MIPAIVSNTREDARRWLVGLGSASLVAAVLATAGMLPGVLSLAVAVVAAMAVALGSFRLGAWAFRKTGGRRDVVTGGVLAALGALIPPIGLGAALALLVPGRRVAAICVGLASLGGAALWILLAALLVAYGNTLDPHGGSGWDSFP